MTFPRKDLLGGKPVDLTPPTRPSFNPAEPDQTPLGDPPQNTPSFVQDVRPAVAPLERDARSLPTPPDKCPNVIAAGARWKGSLVVGDSVRIDGQVNGDIEAKGTVHVAEGAQVEAKVKAAFVVICGVFKGEVRCSERLELLPKSKVQGDLVTRLLNVHEGATIDGSVRMSEDRITETNGARSEREGGHQNGSRGGRGPDSPA